jgi:hypothetical protein
MNLRVFVLFSLVVVANRGFGDSIPIPYDDLIRDPRSIETLFATPEEKAPGRYDMSLEEGRAHSAWFTRVDYSDSRFHFLGAVAHRNRNLMDTADLNANGQEIRIDRCLWNHKPAGCLIRLDNRITVGGLEYAHHIRYWDSPTLTDLQAALRGDWGRMGWELGYTTSAYRRSDNDLRCAATGDAGLSWSFPSFTAGIGARASQHPSPRLWAMTGENVPWLLKGEIAPETDFAPVEAWFDTAEFYWRTRAYRPDDNLRPVERQVARIVFENTWGPAHYTLYSECDFGRERYLAVWNDNSLRWTRSRDDFHVWKAGLGGDWRLFSWRVDGLAGERRDFDSRLAGELSCRFRTASFTRVGLSVDGDYRMLVRNREQNRVTPVGWINYFEFLRTNLTLAAAFPINNWRGTANDDDWRISLTIEYGTGAE